jgi:hypothetical protein
MNLRVVETQDWTVIEQAAQAANTCIRPNDGPNNVRARETWENNPGKIRYFVQESRSSTYQWSPIGYVRLHRVSENFNTALPLLWIVDFCSPFNYRAIRLVQQQLDQPLLTHKRPADDDDVAFNWITLPLRLSMAGDYSFHQCQGSVESGWLLVA